MKGGSEITGLNRTTLDDSSEGVAQRSETAGAGAEVVGVS